MSTCRLCHSPQRTAARCLEICGDCLRRRPREARALIDAAHGRSREEFRLPARPPDAEDGIGCDLCVNACRIPPAGTGYCGLRVNVDGRLAGVSADQGKLSWYHDPLPTNCVGDWVCAGGTGAGYPRYAYRSGPERGYYNLAVFFHACSMNCLYCQNWHFRQQTARPPTTSAAALAGAVDARTACICYFGGDPSPQLPFALKASKLALEANPDRILRICWETNGTMHPRLLDRMIDLSLRSGGCIKFDLKAFDDTLHQALTGISGRRTRENFARAAARAGERPDPPLLLAGTLLVPGYVDAAEVRRIARFIADLDPEIPYSLLAFYPHFAMQDLPMTTLELARDCETAARDEGLERVRIGNRHLLI